MSNEEPFTEDTVEDDDAPPPVALEIPEASARDRLDKALAAAVDPDLGLSRSRLRALIEAGRVALDGATVLDPSRKVKPGETYLVSPPPPEPTAVEAEAIPLSILYEDDQLIVVDKPSGMAVHPAPGSQRGTLVNALLHHCGDSLSGVGGEARPGIVHRIDKETSGVLVVAKTDLAHQALSRQFAEHTAERAYLALVWGAPDRGDPRLLGLPGVSFEGGWGRIEAPIARHRNDRKRMAVVAGGRRAVTRFRVRDRIGEPALVSMLECRLETGRTHQIRVHLSHVGHPLVGDPVYGRPRKLPKTVDPAVAEALSGFPRQALHAALLGFIHPVSGETLRFASSLPEDYKDLITELGTEIATLTV